MNEFRRVAQRKHIEQLNSNQASDFKPDSTGAEARVIMSNCYQSSGSALELEPIFVYYIMESGLVIV